MMYRPCDWVRAINPESKKMETVLVIDRRKGEYLVDNGWSQWWTYMVRAPLVMAEDPPKIRRKR